MANRYWVSYNSTYSGNWNDTNHWSTTREGAGGASVPTSTDSAIIDTNYSFPYTITLTGDATCYTLDLEINVTLDFSGYDLYLYGDLHNRSDANFIRGTDWYIVISASTCHYIAYGNWFGTNEPNFWITGGNTLYLVPPNWGGYTSNDYYDIWLLVIDGGYLEYSGNNDASAKIYNLTLSNNSNIKQVNFSTLTSANITTLLIEGTNVTFNAPPSITLYSISSTTSLTFDALTKFNGSVNCTFTCNSFTCYSITSGAFNITVNNTFNYIGTQIISSSVTSYLYLPAALYTYSGISVQNVSTDKTIIVYNGVNLGGNTNFIFLSGGNLFFGSNF